MNCLECVGNAEEGNLQAVKDHQKTCSVFLSNQCTNYAMRGTFDETVQDTLIGINPQKWSAARKALSVLVLFVVMGLS